MNTIKQVLRLALRLGRRSIGLQENRMLSLCIIVCTCVAASLSFFGKSVQTALDKDIASFLGAPMVVRSGKPILQNIPEVKGIKKLVGTTTLTNGAIADEAYQSVSLKGISRGYPLEGELIVRVDGKNSLTTGRNLSDNTAWLDQRAMDELNIDIGDKLQIGAATLTVAGEIILEPDRLTQLQHTLPRVMVSLKTLEHTGVLVDNDRIDYRVLVSGDASALVELEDGLPALMPKAYKVLKPNAGAHPFSRISVRAERMLTLVLVLILLMCGSAAASLAGHSVRRYAMPTAVLRCMGVTRGAVTGAFCLQLIFLTFMMSLVGCLLGWLIQPLLISVMKPHMNLTTATVRAWDLIGPISVGLVAVIAFVFPRLQQLSSVSVSSVLRGRVEMPKNIYLTVVCATAVLVLMLWNSSDNMQLTIMLVCSLALLMSLSIGIAWALSKLSSQIHRFLSGPLKVAVRAIGRSPQRHFAPLLSVALAMMAILMTTTLRGSFIDALQVHRLESDGNYIYTGLPAARKDAFIELLSAKDVEFKGFYPTVSAKLVGINGAPIDQVLDKESETREQTRSKVRLSWAEQAPDNNSLLEGHWPQLGSHDVSVEKEVMEDLGLSLGDVLNFQIGEAVLSAKISSSRKYIGGASSMMFWFMFAPGTLQQFDQSFMGGLLLKEGALDTLGLLAKAFPQVRITNLERQISRLRDIVAVLTKIMNAILSLLLGGALLIIVASSHVNAANRERQLSLMRTFGLQQKQAYLMNVGEQLTISLVACLVGMLGVQVIAGSLFETLFAMPYSFNWPLALSITALMSIVFALLGCFFAFRSLRHPVRQRLA